MIPKSICLKRARTRASKVKKLYALRMKKIARKCRLMANKLEIANRVRSEVRPKPSATLQAARRLERIKINGGSHTKEEWEALKSKSDGKCVFCGSDEKVQRDHIIPIFRGGKDSIDNIQPLCWACNFRKGIRLITNFEKAISL